jgi:hypothetical protein
MSSSSSSSSPVGVGVSSSSQKFNQFGKIQQFFVSSSRLQ